MNRSWGICLKVDSRIGWSMLRCVLLCVALHAMTSLIYGCSSRHESRDASKNKIESAIAAHKGTMFLSDIEAILGPLPLTTDGVFEYLDVDGIDYFVFFFPTNEVSAAINEYDGKRVFAVAKRATVDHEGKIVYFYPDEVNGKAFTDFKISPATGSKSK